MGLEGTGGLDWLSRVFRGPSWGLVIKKKQPMGNQTKRVKRNDEHIERPCLDPNGFLYQNYFLVFLRRDNIA